MPKKVIGFWAFEREESVQKLPAPEPENAIGFWSFEWQKNYPKITIPIHLNGNWIEGHLSGC